MTFEQIIVEKLSAFDPTLKAARKGASAVFASGKLLVDGEIKGIPKKLAEAEDELSCALDGIRAFRQQWSETGVEGYFGSEDYITELILSLEELGVDVHQMDDVMYVYPALVRLDASSFSVRIDKKLQSKVRPSALAKILRDIQNRPSKFPAGRFLASIFKVYKALGSRNLKKGEEWTGKSMYLKDIYEMISSAPGSDYTEQEFVRDIYLLDASGEDLETRGHLAVLEASSGTRDEKKTLSIITRDGQKRLYCSIRFDPVTR